MAERDLDEGISAQVKEHLVPLLREALSAAAERHGLAVDRGADNFSFGTDAWSLPARLFKERAERGGFPFQVSGPGCVLTIGSTVLRHHRVGWSEREPIETSFPGNARAAAISANQLSFGFGSDEMPSEVEDLVLAYMANPQSGLCAAYLARVGSVENGKIVGWSSTVEVWRRQEGAVPPSVAGDERPPAEETIDPVVTLVKKSDESVK